MIKLFLDIETLPIPAEKHHILKELHAFMQKEGKDVDFEQMLANTSFDGGFGRIACISYAINDQAIKTLKGDEAQMLKDFWDVAKTASLFIGFNLMSFDLRFIYQRSIVLQVKPSIELNFARYRNSPIYDIMFERVKWDGRSSISLHRLAVVLGLPTSKDGAINGANVAKAFEDGRIDEICEYCEKDVELTRKIYKKMVFEGT